MVNVSIVTYDTPVSDLKSIIRSIDVKKDLINKVFIIDNSPEDGLRKYKFGSKVVYKYMGKNLGYGAAHNIGIRESIKNNIPCHLIVNADVYFEPEILSKLYTKMCEDESIVILTPKILYPNKSTQYLCKLLPNPFDLFLRRFIPFQKVQLKHQNKYELRFMDYDQEMEVPNLTGCFMFCRTSTLEKLDGFDERFFMYLEDVDLTRRLSLEGKTLYFPEVSVIHNYEKESYKNSKLLKIHMISAVKYFNKWGWVSDSYRKEKNSHLLNIYKRLKRKRHSDLK